MAGKNVTLRPKKGPISHHCFRIPRSWLGPTLDPKTNSLEALLINVFSVADSENEDLVSQDSVDHPVITDAIFPKTCELSFEDWIGVSVLRTGSGSDQANLLIFRLNRFKNTRLEALGAYFHTRKCPSNVSLHIQLSG